MSRQRDREQQRYLRSLLRLGLFAAAGFAAGMAFRLFYESSLSLSLAQLSEIFGG